MARSGAQEEEPTCGPGNVGSEDGSGKPAADEVPVGREWEEMGR